MWLPLVVFIVLLFIGREDVGWKDILGCLLGSVALLFACFLLGFSLYVFIAIQALFDVILLLVIFGGDITIR